VGVVLIAEQMPPDVVQPGWELVLFTGIAALLVAATGFVSRHTWSRRVLFTAHVLSTIVHEAGHAASTIVTGGGVYLIKVTSPGGGHVIPWHPSWFSSVVGTFGGYATPPLAGLGLAALLAEGKVAPALVLTTVAMALVLTVSRDLLTVVCVGTVGFAAFAALYWGPVEVQLLVAYSEAWLLLLCELAGVWVLVTARMRGHGSDSDDAAALARKTAVPGPVWILAWLAVNGWALWVAVPLLWP
jgi:hypothetical protein